MKALGVGLEAVPEHQGRLPPVAFETAKEKYKDAGQSRSGARCQGRGRLDRGIRVVGVPAAAGSDAAGQDTDAYLKLPSPQ